MLESEAPDPNDPATIACTPPPNRDYTVFLKRDGLKGARIGIPRAFYYDKVVPPGEKDSKGGLQSDQAALMAEAIEFLKQMNIELHGKFPGVLTVAEESTAWPGVSHPTYTGGLGFTYKWNMGWMNDSLSYMSEDSVHKKYHHDKMAEIVRFAEALRRRVHAGRLVTPGSVERVFSDR